MVSRPERGVTTVSLDAIAGVAESGIVDRLPLPPRLSPVLPAPLRPENDAPSSGNLLAFRFARPPPACRRPFAFICCRVRGRRIETMMHLQRPLRESNPQPECRSKCVAAGPALMAFGSGTHAAPAWGCSAQTSDRGSSHQCGFAPSHTDGVPAVTARCPDPAGRTLRRGSAHLC